MLGILRDEVEQVEHRLPVLACAEEHQRGVVRRLGAVGVERVGPRGRRGRGGWRRRRPDRRRRRDQRPGLAQLLLGGVEARAQARRLGTLLADGRLELRVAGVQRAQLLHHARQLPRGHLVGVAKLAHVRVQAGQIVLHRTDRAARGAAGREQRDGGERRESPMHRGATVARTIKGCQKSRVRFENSQRDQVLTSLRTITSTSPPVATLVSPCKTASPSASTIDRRIPDPWSPVSRALHRPFRASRTTRR